MATLPQSTLGIALLRERLSKFLLAPIAAELPSLIDEIERKSTACRAQLQKLGQPRASLDEQRRYLLTLSQICQSFPKAAVDGTYNNPFFGDAKTNSGYQKRIRAVVQNLGQDFAETLARQGHIYAITDSSREAASNLHRSESKVLTRTQFLDRIQDLMKRTAAASSLESLARSHIKKVARTSTYTPLFQTLISPALETIIKGLEAKTTDLLAPRGHPITYNHYFTETVQNVRRERTRAEFTSAIKDFFNIKSLKAPNGCSYHGTLKSDYSPLLEVLMARNEPDMNRYACSEALDCMQAYYKVALKSFIDDVTIEAIEVNIIAKLGDILSPIKVIYLAADAVTSIAGGLEESKERRKQLVGQLEVLGKGLETCKRFMVGKSLRTGSHSDSNDDVYDVVPPSPAPSSISARTSSGELIDDEVSQVYEASEAAAYRDIDEQPRLSEDVVECDEGVFACDALPEVLPELVRKEQLDDPWGFAALSKKDKKKGKDSKIAGMIETKAKGFD